MAACMFERTTQADTVDVFFSAGIFAFNVKYDYISVNEARRPSQYQPNCQQRDFNQSNPLLSDCITYCIVHVALQYSLFRYHCAVYRGKRDLYKTENTQSTATGRRTQERLEQIKRKQCNSI